MHHQIELQFQLFPTQYKIPELLLTSKSLGISKVFKDTEVKLNINNAVLGFHDITVQLVNKESTDTIVDADGKIIEDLHATIDSIKLDSIEFKNKINAFSEYKDNSGNQISTFGYLSSNQEYSMIIQLPGWYFMRNIDLMPENNVRMWLYKSFEQQNLNSHTLQ